MINTLLLLLTLLSPTPRHSTDYRVMGSPTISLQAFCGVLRAYHSPAAGECAVFYLQGVNAHVDPVMWLAWGKEESEFFTDGGSSLRNHNVGNIRCGNRYCYYATFADGSAAWYRLMVKYATKWQRPDVASIIPMYAPNAYNWRPWVRVSIQERLINKWRALR